MSKKTLRQQLNQGKITNYKQPKQQTNKLINNHNTHNVHKQHY